MLFIGILRPRSGLRFMAGKNQVRKVLMLLKIVINPVLAAQTLRRRQGFVVYPSTAAHCRYNQLKILYVP